MKAASVFVRLPKAGVDFDVWCAGLSPAGVLFLAFTNLEVCVPIQWRKEMSVGNIILDLDHRYLISLINLIEAYLRDPEQTGMVMDTLNQLESYAKEHFQREERIQFAIKYSGYLEHKLSHQNLLSRLEEVMQEVESSLPESAQAINADAVAGLLRHWLIDHILKEDRQMLPHLRLHPQNLLA